MSSKRPPPKAGSVRPDHVLRDEYGFNADNLPTIVVDPNEVPVDLRPLIPHVERWAIPCDVTRGDYFEREGAKAVAAFYDAVEPHAAAIDAWLDSQPESVDDWCEAAVHFMYLMKAYSEAWQPTAQEQRDIDARLAARQAEVDKKRALEHALAAFQARDYVTVVEKLAPYEDELRGSDAAKLRFARKKAALGKTS